jgi:hypothetical protein
MRIGPCLAALGLGTALGISGCVTTPTTKEGAEVALPVLRLTPPELRLASASAVDAIQPHWINATLNFGKGLEFTFLEQQALSQTVTTMRPLFCDNHPVQYVLKVESIAVHRADGTSMRAGGVVIPERGSMLLEKHTLANPAYKLYAHELAHWLVGFSDPVTCTSYRTMQENPLVQEWMQKLGWSGFDTRAASGFEAPPTEYAKTDAGEDVADSVMMFMTERAKLLEVAPQRHAFILDLFRRLSVEVPAELREGDLPAIPTNVTPIHAIPQPAS